MDVRLAVASKRDARDFSGAAVPEGTAERILDAGRLAGSARNRQPCRFVIPDTRRLLTVLFDPGAVQNRRLRFSRWRELAAYVGDFFRPRTRYFVFRWRDPLPALTDLAGVARKALAGGLGALLGRLSRGARRSRASPSRSRSYCCRNRALTPNPFGSSGIHTAYPGSTDRRPG